MRARGVQPDKRHYSMAMFTCVCADLCPLAEAIYASLPEHSVAPDTALVTLQLRALLQQGKWDEADALFRQMRRGRGVPRPNAVTLNYLLQFQVRHSFIVSSIVSAFCPTYLCCPPRY